VRDAIEYWAVVAVREVACRLPDAMIRAGGSVIGLTFYSLDRAHRRVALTNLEQCFPNRPEAERRAIARAMFAHFGQVLLRLLTFSALTPEQMLERAEYEGDERVRLAYAQGKGVLFFTGHFGFWECQALAHGVKLRPIGVLARALDNPRLNDLLERKVLDLSGVKTVVLDEADEMLNMGFIEEVEKILATIGLRKNNRMKKKKERKIKREEKRQ